MVTNKLRAIDLFCGAGGSSYGATQANIEVVAGFDIWPLAIKTYSTNFPKAKVFQEDLRSLSGEGIKSIKSQIGDIDLILASPECTNHSRAKGSAERSEISRETAFDVIKFAKEFKPQWIIIENVVEMEFWDRYKDLLEELWNLRYFVRKVVLNAKDFGVPQSRKRLFLLCSLTGKAKEPSVMHVRPNPISSVIDTTGKYRFSPVRQNRRAENTIKSVERAIESLGNNEPFLLTYYGSGRKGNGGWQRISEPIGTITTLDRFAYVVPSRNGHMMRMLQPEELKLAMGFNPDFILEGIDGLTRRDQIKLLGNGVCPPVMSAIVGSLVTYARK